MPRAIWNGKVIAETDAHELVEDDQENKDAAWYYPEPKPATANIKDHIAFWRGVALER